MVRDVRMQQVVVQGAALWQLQQVPPAQPCMKQPCVQCTGITPVSCCSAAHCC